MVFKAWHISKRLLFLRVSRTGSTDGQSQYDYGSAHTIDSLLPKQKKSNWNITYFSLLASVLKYVTMKAEIDVHGSVHHDIDLTEIPARCDRVVEFIIPVFLNCSTCFEWHAAHHQELKNMAEPWQLPTTTNVCKTRDCNYSFWAPDDERCVARNMLSN